MNCIYYKKYKILVVLEIFMKNLFGYFKKGDNSRRDKFILRELKDDNRKEIEELRDETQALEKKKKIPFWVSILIYILALAGLVIVGAFMKNLNKFSQLMESVGYLFYIGVGLIVVAIGLTILISYHNKKLNQDPEVLEFVDEATKKIEDVKAALEIPSTAIDVDIVISMIKLDKNGSEKIVKMLDFFGENNEVSLFVEDNKLCIADIELVLGIPLDSIIGFELVDKKIKLPSWNKEDNPKSEKYSEYVRTVSDGIILNNYYQLVFEVEQEKYYTVIPNYEYNRVKNLIDNNK